MQVYAHRGILPRAVHRLFEEKEAKPEAGIVIHMSYLEIYQEVYISRFFIPNSTFTHTTLKVKVFKKLQVDRVWLLKEV